jgi:hypothetical protein
MGLFSLIEGLATGGARTKALAEKAPPAVVTPGSPAELAEVRKAVEKQIDDFLRTVGFPDPAALTDEHGWRHMQLGSASGSAAVVELDGGRLFLRAQALVMPLPSDGDLLVPLMRELLELNFGMPMSGRIGIGGEAVWVEVMLGLSNVHPDAAAWCIQNVMSLADQVDDMLKDKYGGTSKKRASGRVDAASGKKKVDRSDAARKAHATRARNRAAAASVDKSGE